jgi:hypothetical protein
MKPMSHMAISTFRRAFGRGAFAALSLAMLAACSTNDLLNVERPDIIDPAKLQGALGATALYNGAIGDIAYSQGTFSGLMLASSMFTDEFMFGGTPPEVRQFDLGAIQVENSFSQSIYLNLHRGRVSAEKAAVALAAVDPSDKRIGEMNAYQALTTIWIGETYCAGAPLSDYGPPIVYGNPLSTEEIFQAAVDLLNNAAATAGSDARIGPLIAVLKGRALLDLGQYAAAAAAVASVPDDFVFQMLFSSSDARTQNNMKAFVFDFDYMSVSDHEGTNGLDFASADDPRVPVNFTGPSRFDGKTPDNRLLTYQNFGDPIINASGVEARLIEAEAALNANDITTWLDKLNEARQPWSLPPLTDPGTASARVDLTFRERAFALFATAHRLGDLRRLVRQYGRASNTVFPTGAYHKDNLTRGDQASIVVPQTEQNNPNYSRSDCDPSKP